MMTKIEISPPNGAVRNRRRAPWIGLGLLLLVVLVAAAGLLPDLAAQSVPAPAPGPTVLIQPYDPLPHW